MIAHLLRPRLAAIIVKELWAVLRDPRARVSLILPPLIQLMVFGYASTLEVKNVTLGVLDRDGGQWSHEIIQRVAGSPNFKQIVRLDSDEALKNAIDTQKVIVRFASIRIFRQMSARGAARSWARCSTVANRTPHRSSAAISIASSPGFRRTFTSPARRPHPAAPA